VNIGLGVNMSDDTVATGHSDEQQHIDQAAFNRVLRREKDKYKAKEAKLLQQIDELRTGTLTIEEFDERVGELTQTAEQRLTAAEKKYQKQLADATAAAQATTTKYVQYRKQNDIRAAALEAGVLPKKLKYAEALLNPMAALGEDDTVRVKIGPDPGDELTLVDALAKMRADAEEYGDLFQGQAAGGLGGSNAGAGKPLDVKSANKNMADYAQKREHYLQTIKGKR
jgi:hypothetical protein